MQVLNLEAVKFNESNFYWIHGRGRDMKDAAIGEHGVRDIIGHPMGVTVRFENRLATVTIPWHGVHYVVHTREGF